MTTLSLREAAEQTGVSKSTIFRAIRAGKLSAARTADGNFEIDPAELFRVYPPKTADVAPERATESLVGHSAPDAETAMKLALLDAEVKALREMVAELRNDRNAWQQQTERMTLALSGPKESRSWWRRLAG
jgi:excisionase family DNA binding protein